MAINVSNRGIMGATKDSHTPGINFGQWEVPTVTNNAVLMTKTIGGILLALAGGCIWAFTGDAAAGTFLAGGGIGLLGGATVQPKPEG